MFEQGGYGRYTVATRVTNADSRDWWRRSLKSRWWDDGSLTGDSAAAAIALVVDRKASADGRAGLGCRIDFLCWFLLLFLLRIAPDAGEEEQGLAVLWVMTARMLTQVSQIGRVS
jgi:hypothetical protein